MEPLLAHTVLRRELTKIAVEKYSVTQYCNAVHMSRGTFYSIYTGMADLFCNTLQFEIKTHFSEYYNCDLRKLLFAFIREIGDYRIYYTNIYRITYKKKGIHICNQLNRTFFKEMQKHMLNSDYSNKRIKSLTNMIFSRIKDWVAHNCSERVLDVYTDLACLLP